MEKSVQQVVRQTMGGVQWLLFMFVNTIVIPLSIAEAFGLSAEVLHATVQRSFVFTGLACLLQVAFGHRLPLMEGQSGLWWGVMLSLGSTAAASGMTAAEAGGALTLGMMASGAMLAAVGAAGIGRLLQRWFSPVVMSSFLLLLGSQLTGTFFKGMVGWSSGSGTVNVTTALLSLAIIVLVLLMMLKGKGRISQFAILIGIAAGWLVYALWLPAPAAAASGGAEPVGLFALGKPSFHAGILFTCLVTGLLNTTNTVASLKGAEALYDTKATDAQYRRSFFWSGVNGIASGLLGLVPYAPYTSSLGFLRSTRILERLPFVLGSFFFMVLGIVPVFSRFFATLPISVGDAVLFVAYLQLFGSALQQLEGIRFTYNSIYRIALPVMVGLALMTMPAAAFASLPAIVRPLCSNGLLMGILLSIVMNNLWRREETE